MGFLKNQMFFCILPTLERFFYFLYMKSQIFFLRFIGTREIFLLFMSKIPDVFFSHHFTGTREIFLLFISQILDVFPEPIMEFLKKLMFFLHLQCTREILLLFISQIPDVFFAFHQHERDFSKKIADVFFMPYFISSRKIFLPFISQSQMCFLRLQWDFQSSQYFVSFEPSTRLSHQKKIFLCEPLNSLTQKTLNT